MSPPQARALRSRTASWTRSRITGWTCQVVPRHRSIERHLGVAPYNWNGSPHDTINAFAKRYENVECSALISWAVFSVECLHYLSDLDSAQAGASSTFDGHTANTIDIAHVRWATGTSVTALDLCAAGLGRAFCGIVDGDRELSLESFGKPKWKKHLPASALEWTKAVRGDVRYQITKNARNPLTHARVVRHFTGSKRPDLSIGGKRYSVREIVETSRDLATERVAGFVEMLEGLLLE